MSMFGCCVFCDRRVLDGDKYLRLKGERRRWWMWFWFFYLRIVGGEGRGGGWVWKGPAV